MAVRLKILLQRLRHFIILAAVTDEDTAQFKLR
jgi:hypothetical protein